MEPTLDVGQRVLVNRFLYHFTDPKPGDIVVFHPPKGADTGTECGVTVKGQEPVEVGMSCPKPTPEESSQNFIKRIVAGPGDTLSVRNGHPVVNGVEKTEESYIRPCGSAPACNLPKPIKIPPGYYFMMGDNRGESDDSRFWGPVPRDGSSARPLPPTGPQIASASSKPAAKGKLHQRRLARTRRLFAFDRGLDSRWVAGADEAGRGCLAGPLVAAAVLIDYETLSHADRRALAGLHDSKQMHAEKRAELFPCVLRAAERVSVVVRCARGIDERGLHVTNIEALSNALERLRPDAARHLPRRRLLAAPVQRAAPGRDRRRRHQRRDRRRLGDRQGHPRPLHAASPPPSTPAGASRSTSATRPPSTARRSSASASRRCTAAPSSQWPTRSSSWPARTRPRCARPRSRGRRGRS